mgnify:CR=1 FL=1
MGVYVYHLLALTFIGVGLKRTGGRTVGAIHIGFIKVLTYIVQALIGLAVALFFLWLIYPDLVPAVGILLPLGFGVLSGKYLGGRKPEGASCSPFLLSRY